MFLTLPNLLRERERERPNILFHVQFLKKFQAREQKSKTKQPPANWAGHDLNGLHVSSQFSPWDIDYVPPPAQTGSRCLLQRSSDTKQWQQAAEKSGLQC